jgi:hypothetical protein
MQTNGEEVFGLQMAKAISVFFKQQKPLQACPLQLVKNSLQSDE